ncbi:MAG: hypothetical protein KAQ63_00035 [Candidatus Moranbacteria bacterium]|nr:hypothetical protein [Candidatus Moranbacteria bacterium]
MTTKKKLSIFGFCFLIIPSVVWAVDISFGNPVGTAGNITLFFQAILNGILNIIAFLGVLFMVIGGVIYLIASSTGNNTLIGTAKKIWVGSLVGLALALAGPSFLKEIQIIVLNGGAMPTDLASAPSLTNIISNTLSFLLSIIGILAIISLVISSILYLTSLGDTSKAEKAKANITYSLIGLLVAGSALIIVKQIIWFIET